MESFRKVIQFGESSHIISLPSEWIKRNNIKKGAVLQVEENGSGELILYPNSREIKIKEITINIEDKSIEDVDRELVSAYINNYKIINLVGNLGEKSKEIKSLVNKLIALQVIEETKNQIVVKDFLNIADISIKDIIRRIDIILKSMIEDSKSSITGENTFKSIYERDIEINKFYFLIHRITKGALTEPYYIKAMHTNYEKIKSIWWLVINLEKMADNTKRFSRDFKKISTSKEEKNELFGLYSLIEEQYLESIKAIFNNDKELAAEIAGNKKRIIEICKEIEDKTNHRLTLFTEKLKAMSSYVKNICRIVIDNEEGEILIK